VPSRRKSFQLGTFKTAPCGGFVRGSLKQLSVVGDGITIQWRVNAGSNNLYCRISISNGIFSFNQIRN